MGDEGSVTLGKNTERREEIYRRSEATMFLTGKSDERNKRRLTTRGAMFALALRRGVANPVRVCFISRLSVSENISLLREQKYHFARLNIRYAEAK